MKLDQRYQGSKAAMLFSMNQYIQRSLLQKTPARAIYSHKLFLKTNSWGYQLPIPLIQIVTVLDGAQYAVFVDSEKYFIHCSLKDVKVLRLQND